MLWFFIGLLGPAFYGVSNHIDKHLLESHFKNLSAGTLFIFGGPASLFVALCVLLLHPAALEVPWRQALILLCGSIVGSGYLYCYLQALRLGETSAVTALFQLKPVFYLVLAYLAFGETLTARQLAGSCLVIIGGVSLSLDLGGNKARLQAGLLAWMSLACLLSSLNGVAFKWVGADNGYLSAIFWDNCGLVATSLAILLLAPKPRQQFITTLLHSRASIAGLLVANEVFTLSANLATRFAQLLAPLALVQALGGFQPVFVFVYGVLLTLFFPRFGYESLMRRHIVQKIMCIFIILVGTFILNS